MTLLEALLDLDAEQAPGVPVRPDPWPDPWVLCGGDVA